MRKLEFIAHIKDFSYIFSLDGTVIPLINFKEHIELGNKLFLSKIAASKIDRDKSDKNLSPNDLVEVSIPVNLSCGITIKVKKPSGDIAIPLTPKVCPICGKPLIEDKPFGRCVNKSCRAQMVTNIILFTSAVGLQFSCPAKKTFEALLSRGSLTTPVNLFKLTNEDFNTPDFSMLEIQAYQNYVHSIRGNTSLDKILLGLNIKDWNKDICSKIKVYFDQHHYSLTDLDILFDPNEQKKIPDVPWKHWNEVISLNCNKNMFTELMEIMSI